MKIHFISQIKKLFITYLTILFKRQNKQKNQWMVTWQFQLLKTLLHNASNSCLNTEIIQISLTKQGKERVNANSDINKTYYVKKENKKK